jgi:phosphate-selective porin OprO/OprP
MENNLMRAAVSIATAGLISSQAIAGNVITEGEDIVIKTKGGFEATTASKDFRFRIGGRVQIQADAFNDSMNLINGDGDTGTDLFFRRARIYIEGDIYSDWAYKLQFNLVDSGSGGGTAEDLYIRWKRYQFANITVGKQKEPFSLEELTSSKYVTSIERSPINDFFAEGRSLGISVHGANNFWGYGFGIFDNRDQFSDSGAQKWAYTGRAFISPINTDTTLIHVGLGATQRNASDNPDDAFDGGGVTQGIRSGDDVQVSIDPIESQSIVALELAGKLGPFHGSGEYHRRETNAADNGEDASADGYYVQAGWIITGESRPYKMGVWDKIKPNNKSLGAWEVFIKQAGVSLDDSGIDADNRNTGSFTTLGVNWYPNEILRLSANYVYTSWDKDLASNGNDLVRADSLELEPGQSTFDSGHGLSMRFQAAF